VAEDVAASVQDRLAAYRRDLYQGRGPGITEEERLANTSLRADVGGVPTAASREELHLRTMLVRGRRGTAAQEAAWAAAQFAVEPGEFTTDFQVRDSRPSVGRMIAILGLLGAALWRAIRRRSRPHGGPHHGQ